MEKVNIFDEIAKNSRNSLLLALLTFFVMGGLIYFIGYVFDPEFSFFFLVVAGIFSIFYIFTTYNYGDKIVLKATGARKPKPKEEIYLINVVEGLSIAAGTPKPKIYVIESDELNAFATGKDPEHASIAVTTGLMEKLNRTELEGVIAHEMSHIRNYDIRFATVVAVVVGLIAILSNILLRSFWYGGGRSRAKGVGFLILIGFILAIFAPIVVRLVQFAISRKREFLADASGAQLTRYPEGLASALEKIMKFNQGKMKVSEAVSHLFFVDPTKSSLDALYATHPPIEKRIEVLRAM